MSKEQDAAVKSQREGPSQPEIPSVSSGNQAPEARPSTSRLTIENVKKLQEDYPVAKYSLARQSVEAYLQQSHLLGKELEVSRGGGKEPNLSNEKESKDRSVTPLGEETAENDAETLEKISNPDFQTRSLTSSAPQTKKREFADLETQTEWSYSSMSQDSRKEVGRPLGQDDLEKEMEVAESEGRITGIPGTERRGTIELGSIADSSEEGVAEMVLESFLKAEDYNVTDNCGCCEFCAAALKPFPTPEELEDKPETMESVSCCRTYKDILQCVMKELMETQSPEGGIDISPHRHLSQTMLNSKTRILLMEELQQHGIENYKDIFEQYMKFGPCVKVGYKLSNYSPKRSSATKKHPPVKELLKIDTEFKPDQAKICHPRKPVKRYYPDGKIFFLLLPDGTGQVYYPSGNIAILITYLQDVQFTYMVLADRPYSRLMAFFTNQGYAACYFPNGNIRLHLDLCWGASYDLRGLQQKCWNWWDSTCHVHAPPFQPISIQFNVYIHLKIEAQDQIFLTFTKLHNCIHLNVGSRLKLKDPAMLPFLKSAGNQKPPVSQAKALKIKTLLAKLREGLKLMHSAPPGQVMHLDAVALILCRVQCWRHKKLPGSQKLSEHPLS